MAKKRGPRSKTSRGKKRVTKKQTPAKTKAKKKVEDKIGEKVELEVSIKETPKPDFNAELEVEELTFEEVEAKPEPLPKKAKKEKLKEIAKEPLVKFPRMRKIDFEEKKSVVPGRLVIIPWVLLLVTVLMIGWMIRGAIYQSKQEQLERKKMTTSQGLVEEIQAGNLAPIAKLEVIGDELNFRSAPQVNPSTFIGKFKKGTVLFVLSQGKGWYLVAVAAGKDGFVKGYITTDPAYTKKIKMESK